LSPLSGDVIVMAGDFQKHFHHRVKQGKDNNSTFNGADAIKMHRRINVTVRAFKEVDAGEPSPALKKERGAAKAKAGGSASDALPAKKPRTGDA